MASLAMVLASCGVAVAQDEISLTPLDMFDEAFDFDDPEAPVPRFKKQAIQKVSLAGGVLLATDDDDLNKSFLEASVTTGIPLGSFERILGITPSFRVDAIDAAAQFDVPDQLYETGVQFFYRQPLNERWQFLGIVSPANRSDWTTDDKAFRVFGLGLFIWDWVPDCLSVSLGAVYLDRADLPTLPAVGLVWTPRPDRRLELQFPRSRFGIRLAKDGGRSETWAYGLAGIGGNTWAVTRADDRSDELSLKETQLLLGVEKIVAGGGGWFAELGYVVGRQIEYESDDSEIPLSDAVMISGGWAY
ncbi:MAG: DUF6268 family outer membrane beta-barrel protein [Planctomycetota bacterium]